MIRTLLPTLLTLMLTAGPALAGDTLDVQKMLSRPGVRLVVVEFYATWCKPCMEAIPRWNALHKKYYDQGLRLIVVNTQDPNGLCGAPGWTPDDMVCDLEGQLATRFGATELPAAYLWSWQGNLLVQRGHVDKVEEAIEDYFLKNPRIAVEATNAKGNPSNFLRDLVRNEFSKQGKFTVVATADERAMAAKVRKESFQSNYSQAGRCKIGEEVSANSIVKVTLQQSRLNLQLFSAEKSCLVQAASVRYNRKNPDRSAAEVVDKLLGQAALPSLVMPVQQSAKTLQAPPRSSDAEEKLWELIKDSKDPAEFDLYLKEYPEGRHAAEAKVLKLRYSKEEASQEKNSDSITRTLRRFGKKLGIKSRGGSSKKSGWPKSMQAKPPEGFQLVKAGSFTMGSPSTEPGRSDDEKDYRVKLNQDFFMMQHEVSQAQFEALMSRNPSTFKACGPQCPVERVSWFDAVEYANRLSDRDNVERCYTRRNNEVIWHRGCKGYRLPTEAEWEYAARANTTTMTYAGNLRFQGKNHSPELDAIAWYAGNSGVSYEGAFGCKQWPERHYDSALCGTHPVGQKKPNTWGLYDMLGNVWEWTWDWKGRYPSGLVNDPSGPSKGVERVTRGGAWYYLAEGTRSASRGSGSPTLQNPGVGFRLVRNAP